MTKIRHGGLLILFPTAHPFPESTNRAVLMSSSLTTMYCTVLYLNDQLLPHDSATISIKTEDLMIAELLRQRNAYNRFLFL